MIFRGLALLFLAFCFNSQKTYCQPFGGHPFSQRWKQINTDTVRIIFATGFEKQASRIARIEHALAANSSLSLGKKFRKINIVLQNRTMEANGYVGLAPFRSEFYTTPPQNAHLLGSLSWLDLLALHEYRHVQQDLNFNKGWNRALYYLSGEMGWALGNNLAIPNWFFEGDAVLNETRFTKQGRGRLPAFYNEYRALFIDKVRYSYAKTRNGSFKDFVPDHYKFGYLMCLQANEKFGEEVWKNTTQNTFCRLPLYPFSRALKKNTGITTKKLYVETLDNFDQKSTTQLGKPDESEILNKTQKNTFTHYQYSYFLPDSTVLALKKAFNQIPTLVLIDGEKEEKISPQGYTQHDYISYRNGYATWTESSFHPRWGWRNYSDIVSLDLKTKEKQRITHRTKLFAPDISPNNMQFAAVEIDELQNNRLVLVEKLSGKIETRLPNPGNLYYSFPKWDETGKYIYVSARNEKGLSAIMKIEVGSGKRDTIVPFLNQPIGQLSIAGKYVVYTAAYQGFDNLHAYDSETKKYYRISHGLVGHYEPSVAAKQEAITFSQFTSKGNNLRLIPFDTAKWENASPAGLDELPQYHSKLFDQNGFDLPLKVDTTTLPATRYKQIKHLVYLHSWGLRTSHPSYGLFLTSKNILNNTAIELGSEYNANENTFRQSGNVTYGGFYPMLGVGSQNGNRSYYTFDSTSFSKFNETRLHVGSWLPLNYTRGLYSRYLMPSAYYSYRILNSDKAPANYLHTIELGFSFLNSRRKAYQHIFSRLGQFVKIDYLNSWQNANTYQWRALSEFTFPGIGRNHVFSVQADYVKDGNANYRFQDLFVYPRGYGRIFQSEMTKIGFNYHMPLFYPDFGIAGIVYFKRIRTNLFFDWSEAYNQSPNKKEFLGQYNSAGAELIFDLNFFNLSPNFSIFVRYSHLLNERYLNKGQENGMWEIGFPLVRIE